MLSSGCPSTIFSAEKENVKNTIALKGVLFLIFCILVFANPCPVWSSNLRLVPLNPEASSGENREYVLLGEGLEGLGSLEVTLLYPPDPPVM